MYKTEDAESAARLGSTLPQPKGYRILVKPLTIKDKTDGGIYRPDDLIAKEEVAAVVALVVRLGPDCYKDKKRFSEPWCKEGDFITFRPYSGTRMKILGHEFRIIYDDTVESVVEDPRGIERV